MDFNLRMIWQKLNSRQHHCAVVSLHAHVIGLPQGSTLGPTRDICWGIQGAGMGYFPKGRVKFKRLFQNDQ